MSEPVEQSLLMPKDAVNPEYAGDDLESLAVLRRYREWIVHFFEPYLSGAAVEFGAGIGSISELLAQNVTSLELVEPSPNLARQLCSRFDGDGTISVRAGDLAQFTDSATRQYDAAILVNVLEHIEHDDDALTRLFGVLKPGGHLLVLVPALPFLYSHLDELVGHYRRYTRHELLDKVRAAGFALEQSRYFDVLGILPWLVFNTWCGATEFNPTLAAIYDRFFVPLSRAIETVIEPPVGKNVILVARRPADPD